jgi:hypothetical protein
MSATGTSLRTIWIEIRAMNYAVNTMNDVLRQLAVLEKQQELTAISCLNMAKAAMSAGILFGVLAGQVGGIGGQMLQFGSYIMYGIAALQGLLAITKMINMENLTATIPIGKGIEIAYWELFATIAVAAGVFYALQGYLGTIPALLLAIAAAASILAVVLWDAAGGMSVLTWGAAAVAGGAALAGVMAMAAGGPHQMGTRMIETTGPHYVEQGEVIYNPATGRPTQIGNELAGGIGGGMTHIDASMHIDNLNTRMAQEDLEDAIKKQGRKIAMDRS